jgi:hypothetical protein
MRETSFDNHGGTDHTPFSWDDCRAPGCRSHDCKDGSLVANSRTLRILSPARIVQVVQLEKLHCNDNQQHEVSALYSGKSKRVAGAQIVSTLLPVTIAVSNRFASCSTTYRGADRSKPRQRTRILTERMASVMIASAGFLTIGVSVPSSAHERDVTMAHIVRQRIKSASHTGTYSRGRRRASCRARASESPPTRTEHL